MSCMVWSGDQLCMLKLSVKICPAQGPHGVSGRAPDEPCIGALHARVRLPWVQCVARANFVEKQRQSAGRAVHRRIARASAAVGAMRPRANFGETAAKRRTAVHRRIARASGCRGCNAWRVRISWRNSGKAPDEPCIGALQRTSICHGRKAFGVQISWRSSGKAPDMPQNASHSHA